MLLSMKLKARKPAPLVYTALEFLDLLFWKLHRILDQEGVSMLQWAFMQRASLDDNGVPFCAILKATGDSKDNVRRAAKFLEQARVGKVIPDPSDGRARIFILTQFGEETHPSYYRCLQSGTVGFCGCKGDLLKEGTAIHSAYVACKCVSRHWRPHHKGNDR